MASLGAVGGYCELEGTTTTRDEVKGEEEDDVDVDVLYLFRCCSITMSMLLDNCVNVNAYV